MFSLGSYETFYTYNMKDYTLQRFLDAQQEDYMQALAEVKNGKKRSHWIWYIFPQLKGLGMSYNSQYYGISGKEEAKAYLEHPVLGARLREITKALLDQHDVSVQKVFGSLDAMKVLSSMTLFREVATDDNLFSQVIDKFYQGIPDRRTVEKL